MAYGLALGQSATDCTQPIDQFLPECMGGAPSPGFDINNLLNTVLNDVTQIIKPGAPSYRPLYTPMSTAAGSLFQSPVVWLLGVGAMYLLVKSRR